MAGQHPVYIVDDDASIRSSLRFLLQHAGFRSIAFESGEAFLAAAPRIEPGCVLLDVRLSGADGLTVQQELRQRGLRFPVVIITGHGEVPIAVSAMKAGAIDFLSKPLSRDDLLSVVELASARLDDETALQCHAEAAGVRLNVLTPREMQVMQFLSLGLPNKSIAYDLGISSRTVEVHRSNIMHKLGVKNFPEALRIAYAAGLPERLPPRFGDAEATPEDASQELHKL
jgi:two-component system response regulator FixJ